VAAFLDISGAYDNNFLDVLYPTSIPRKRAASGNCLIYVEPAVV
jgi:hypothetical protein